MGSACDAHTAIIKSEQPDYLEGWFWYQNDSLITYWKIYLILDMAAVS